MSKKRHRGQWCWCCDRIRANERFSGKNHGRHLCRDCARLPLEERELLSAERDLDRIYWRPGKFKRKRPLIARFLRHHLPWVQLLAEAMLRPREWSSEYDDYQDWQDLAEFGYLHHDPTVQFPDEWWASTLAEVPEAVDDGDPDAWETIPPPARPGPDYGDCTPTPIGQLTPVPPTPQ